MVQFTSFAQKDSIVFVGTDGFGYFTVKDGADINETSFDRMEETTDLFSAAVTGFSTPSGISTLFVHTAGAGLWSSDSASGDSISWHRE